MIRRAFRIAATALLTYEALVEANDVRVLPRVDRIRGHATMAAWAAVWPVAGTLCVGAAIADKIERSRR